METQFPFIGVWMFIGKIIGIFAMALIVYLLRCICMGFGWFGYFLGGTLLGAIHGGWAGIASFWIFNLCLVGICVGVVVFLALYHAVVDPPERHSRVLPP